MEPECVQLDHHINYRGHTITDSQVVATSSKLNVVLGLMVIEFDQCCVYDIFEMARNTGT